ncbi:uncharacterized protein LOC129590971 [Paramacrobiotus metropolitanus]|uniref:uncharacterized protein LOC129590971 n=1 Tax=Paramacrobiotus metropolitanus TaxID=2943436 RepID=UPI002445DA82|nr:uncharacterized protein LOC129590971 [Paramacrobiotus metropolitanus]
MTMWTAVTLVTFALAPLSVVSQTTTLVSEPRDVSAGFNGIAVDGPFLINVELTDGPESLVLKGDPAFVAAVKTPVENGTLKIRLYKWQPKKGAAPLQVSITARSLINLIAAGSAQVASRSVLKAQTMRVVVSGAAQVVANYECANLVVVASQSGSMIGAVSTKNLNAVLDNFASASISGTSDNSNIVASGSAVFHGFDLLSATVSATANGAGRIEVAATQQIKAVAADDGVVRTKGTDDVVKDTTDNGSVEPSA